MDPKEIEELVKGYTPAQKRAILGKAKLLPLHRYFMWSHRFRGILDGIVVPEVSQKSTAADLFAGDFGMFMSYFYASLHVVIEGWQELKLEDPTVDALLKSPNVKLLKRYRNGVFHYQRIYLDARFHELWGEGVNVVSWVRELDEAFSEYFVRQMPLPDEEQ